MINLFSNGNNKEKIKNYNIIIVPEKRGSSKAFSVSINTIKLLTSLFVVMLITVSMFLIKYTSINRKALQSEKNEKKINSLQIENNEKQKRIDNYKKYEKEMNKKLNQLERIENDIKNKVKSSSALKSISLNEKISNSPNVTYSRGGMINIDNRDLIKKIDVEIKRYSALSRKLDNIVKEEQHSITLMPCSGSISSYFGYRKNPFKSWAKDFHPGIDIAANYGSKVYAAAAGTVILAGYYGGYGKAVMIDHHNGYITLYGHNSKLFVSKGKEVKKRQLVSLVGSTGKSTGPHLHFEVRKNGTAVDPLKILRGGS